MVWFGFLFWIVSERWSVNQSPLSVSMFLMASFLTKVLRGEWNILNSVKNLDMIQTCIFLVHGTSAKFDLNSDPAALDPSLLLKYTPAANAQLPMLFEPSSSS
jgi:hypothetical protein